MTAIITQSKKVKGYDISEELGVIFVRITNMQRPKEAIADINEAAEKLGADAVVRLKHKSAGTGAGTYGNGAQYTTFLGTAVKLVPKDPS